MKLLFIIQLLILLSVIKGWQMDNFLFHVRHIMGAHDINEKGCRMIDEWNLNRGEGCGPFRQILTITRMQNGTFAGKTIKNYVDFVYDDYLEKVWTYEFNYFPIRLGGNISEGNLEIYYLTELKTSEIIAYEGSERPEPTRIYMAVKIDDHNQ